MLVFLIALEPLILCFYIALLSLKTGKIHECLPYFAISLMAVSYFLKGLKETLDKIKKFIKNENN